MSKTDIDGYISSYILRSNAGYVVNRPQVGLANSIYGGTKYSYVGNDFNIMIAFEI